jgi:hypothetical protein
MDMKTETKLPYQPALLPGWSYRVARPRDRWIVGVDLGQSTDPTAICALHHTVVPQDSWVPNDKSRQWKQERVERFDVLHLERLPLGMPYPAQVAHVARVLARPPLGRAKLVIDETGVGRAVGDIFNTAGMYPTRITITAGLEATRHGGDTWHVPKAVLISNMEARQHTGELRVAPNATDASALAEEMKDFQRHVTAAGRATWSARTGAHDDLVLAVAIALFEATNYQECSIEPLEI